MKKVLVAGILAIGLIAVSQQQASAWVNNKFSVGFNWHGQSGGNNFCWGLFKNGQVPGPEAYGFSGAAYAPAPAIYQQPMPPGYAPPPYYPPMPAPYYPAPHHHGYEMPTFEPYAGGYYVSPFQFANYPGSFYYYGR